MTDPKTVIGGQRQKVEAPVEGWPELLTKA
jgi:hypothetical protein